MNRPGRYLVAPLACLALGALTGCGGGLRVKQIDAAQERPANVLVFFRVTGGDQSGVPGLEESAFNVKEDDHEIAAGVDRVIVNPDLRATQATMILVDLGGRPSADELDAVALAAGVLVERLGASKHVGLYALDGAAELFPLAPFGASQDALKAAAAKIPSYKTRDASLDLNGGYVSALHTLKQSTAPSGAGPRIANLVLIARGPDRATRIDQRAVSDEIKKTDLDVRRFAVAFGPETEKAKLDVFADGPVAHASSVDQLRDQASKVADAVDERGRSFYLLSYCTAARGGQHKVRVQVERERTEISGEKRTVTVDHGSLSYAFKADGFGPGCTPNVPEGWRNDAAHVAAGALAETGSGTSSPKVDTTANEKRTGGKASLGNGANGKVSPKTAGVEAAVPAH